MIEEETVYPATEVEPIADMPQDEEPLPEASNEVSEEKNEDAIAAVLEDPEKLEEKKTPKQLKAELKQLKAEEKQIKKVEKKAAPSFEGAAGKTVFYFLYFGRSA